MRSLNTRAVCCIFRRHYVTATSPHVTKPLNYLNGQRIDPENTENFPLAYPATGETLRDVRSSGDNDVNAAVKNSRQTFLAWARTSGFERGKILSKAASLIRERSLEIAQTEVLDTGKPIWEALVDVEGCADSLDYYAGIAPTLAGEHLQFSGGSFGYTRREPLGVVGAIGAWNYPFQMAAWKSAPALACGNTMVFKPSPLTPLTAVMLADIYTEAGVPDGCFNVVQGSTETGQLLSSHSDVAKMSFTGSVSTGSKVMKACAEGIRHVTLELGGKSPLIIFGDSDINNAVKGAMLANFLNQGQVCSNGTRVFVENSIMGEFVDKLVARTTKMRIGDPMLSDTTVGATISPEQAEKTLKYVDLGRKEGAQVLCGGERVIPSDQKLRNGYFLSPCILSGCHDNMRVVQEEVFGAVMSLLSFDCEDEVIRRANDTELGLAGGVFTRDLKRAHRVVAQMEAGSIYINNYNILPVGLPFGGYKKSGIGRENGKDTVDYYTQLKSVYVEMGDVDCPI